MKKILTIGITIIVILVAVIGGKVYMDNKKEKEQVRQAEKELALYIVQNYEGVKKIEFNNFHEVTETGSFRVTATINDDNILKIAIDDFKSTDTPTIGYNPEVFNPKEKLDERKNIANIKVIYSEEINE